MRSRKKKSLEADVSYIKAEELLPEELIRQIQQYVDGTYLYIPRKPGSRRAWGQETDYRAELLHRNRCICRDWAAGMTVSQLCRNYHLSETSIRRILRQKRT